MKWTYEEMAAEKMDPAEVKKLVDSIAPLLKDKHPGIQGAALAKLTGIWLGGHTPELRTPFLKLHIETVESIAAEAGKILWRGDA